MSMAVGVLHGPCPMIGYCLRSSFVDGLHLFGRDIQIANDAKLSVQPLQFALYSWLFGIDNHRREKPDSRAQPRERDAHLMQSYRATLACRRMICGQIPEMAATSEGDPVALHQMRNALTRLRTAIWFFSPMV